MKHAIIILVYHLPEQVNLFIDQILKSTNFDIYIHVDKKFEYLKDELIKDERIFVSDKNISIYWGTDSLLRCMLIMMQEVLDSGKEYGHILINADNDLMVKKGIEDFLNNHLKQVFIYSKNEDRERRVFIEHRYPKYMMKQIDFKYHPIKILRSLRMKIIRKYPFIFKRKLAMDTSAITFFYSTFWGAIPLDVIKYVVTFAKTNDKFMQLFLGSFVAEESFMATLINMSPFKDYMKYDNRGKTYSLHHILGVENAHPLVVEMKDVEAIELSGCFFARKFDIRVDRDVVEYYHKKIVM